MTKTIKFFIILLAVVAVALADDLSNCRCQVGYVATKTENGDVQCYGVTLKSIMPCNVPKRPRCKCGPEVTGIIHDASGIWCSTYHRGTQVRRWPCENVDEWRTFYSQLHPQEPSVKNFDS